MSRPNQRGNMALEVAMWMPFILLLLVGMVQFGKITYTYYTLKKTLYTAARYLATQQDVNFCDTADPNIIAALNYALTGTTDGSGTPAVPSLTTDMITVATECYDSNAQALGPCTSTGCDTAAGGPRPDFVVVSIPAGYPMQPRIPYILLDPIPLKPLVRVPFGGT